MSSYRITVEVKTESEKGAIIAALKAIPPDAVVRLHHVEEVKEDE